MNEIRDRIFKLYPTIAAWARSGSGAPWGDAGTAKAELAQYIGPAATNQMLECHHIRNAEDQAFVRSGEAFEVICHVVDQIYGIAPREVSDGRSP